MAHVVAVGCQHPHQHEGILRVRHIGHVAPDGVGEVVYGLVAGYQLVELHGADQDGVIGGVLPLTDIIGHHRVFLQLLYNVAAQRHVDEQILGGGLVVGCVDGDGLSEALGPVLGLVAAVKPDLALAVDIMMLAILNIILQS